MSLINFLMLIFLVLYSNLLKSQRNIGSYIEKEIKYLRLSVNYSQIERLIRTNSISFKILEYVPSIFPIKSDVRISSGYGLRLHPVDKIYKFHNGIDISCGFATEVYATASGYVDAAGYGGTIGNYVLLSHLFGFQTQYGHLLTVLVNKGDYVFKGQIIGLAAATGKAAGIHVHYSVKKNYLWVDPLPFCFLTDRLSLNRFGKGSKKKVIKTKVNSSLKSDTLFMTLVFKYKKYLKS